MQKETLSGIKSILKDVYKERLKGIILYGSEVRGDAAPDSDLDLLVLLKGPVSLGSDLEIIIQAIYPLQLELERPIHVQPVDIADFEAGEFALYRNARKEGVFA